MTTARVADPSSSPTSSKANSTRAVARHCAAMVLSARTGDAVGFVKRTWPDDTSALLLTRATTSPYTTANTPELLGHLHATFLSGLAPQSAAVRLFARALKLNFDGKYQFSIPYAATSPEPVFTGEGNALPVSAAVLANTVIGPVRKMLLATVTTAELDQSQPETATAILSRLLSDQAAKSLDAVVFDDTGANDNRPAGLLNSVTPIPATAGGVVAMASDLAAIVGAIADAGGNPDNVMFIAAPKQAMALRFLAGPVFNAYTVVSCAQLDDATVIGIDPAGIATGYLGLPEIDVSGSATLHMSNAPLPIVSGGVTADPVRDVFQTNSLAVRLRMKTCWGPLAPGVVQIINSTSW